MHLNLSACIRILVSLSFDWELGLQQSSTALRLVPTTSHHWSDGGPGSEPFDKGLLVCHHCGWPYMKQSLTVHSQTIFSISLLAPKVVSESLLWTARLCLPLTSALVMCSFQICLLSNGMPKQIASSSSFSRVPPRWRSLPPPHVSDSADRIKWMNDNNDPLKFKADFLKMMRQGHSLFLPSPSVKCFVTVSLPNHCHYAGLQHRSLQSHKPHQMWTPH